MRLLERLPALAHRDYRNLQIGSFVSNIGNRMQWATILWQVYHLTGSNGMVGAIGLFQVVPLLILSLFGGLVADQFDRRGVLLLTNLGMGLVSVLAFYVTLRDGDHLGVGWLYTVVALNAVSSAFNGPARQAMIASLVPAKDFPNAASINGILWRLSDILGPVLAGVLIASPGAAGISGLAWCYLLNCISFGSVLFAVAILPKRPADLANRSKSLREVLAFIHEGLVFVWNTRVVRSALFIDFWATMCAGAEALMPAFSNILNEGGSEQHAKIIFGWLMAAQGVGALLASMVLAWAPTIKHQGRWVLAMIACYGLFTILFGVSNHLITAFIFLAAIGASDMISTVMRQTIRQLATPDEMRGRMSAASMILQLSGPKLGDFEAGELAEFTGARWSVVVGGIGSLLVAAWFSRSRALRDYEHKSESLDVQ